MTMKSRSQTGSRPSWTAGAAGRFGCVARLVGNERHGSRWSWLVGSGSEVKLGRGLGEALPAVDLAQGDLA